MARLSASKRAEQILQAATTVFARTNYQTASVSEIAGQAGITEPLIYRHFGSKKQLFITILRTVAEKILRRWDRICGESPHSLDRLRRIGGMYLQELREHPDELTVLFQAASEAGDPEIQKVLVDTYQGYAAYLEQIIRVGQEKGEISKGVNARNIAWELVGYGAANSLFFTLGLNEWSLSDQQRQLNDLLKRIEHRHRR
jgi:AcrR family transcriptional regulator